MEIIKTADGSVTLFSKEYGQCYHSASGAVLEARDRFALPCRIRELARRGRIAFLDVGFGLGYNTAAALEAASTAGGAVSIKGISLEKDPVVVEFVRDFTGPQELTAHYGAVRVLAKSGKFTSGSVDLSLLMGDAAKVIGELPREPVFDAVFHDPFSPRSNPELWTVEFFKELAARMHPEAILSTYSSATAVKVNLLGAGFRIGKGPKVGDKGTGTLASLGADLPPLPGREMKKLLRRVEKILRG